MYITPREGELGLDWDREAWFESRSKSRRHWRRLGRSEG